MKQTFDKLQSDHLYSQNFLQVSENPLTNLARTAAQESPSERQMWVPEERKPVSLSLARHGTAIFAHEVANSLAVISCSIQFVKKEFEAKNVDDPMLSNVIESALREIDGLGTLLREYRTPTHSQNLNFEITDLAKVVEDVMDLQSLACRAAGIVVKFERENTLPRVKLDALKMKQVIINLCKNATEAMPRGGYLTVKVYRSERLVVLEVSDNGVGVPQGLNVFELLKTTKPGGRGLGLPLAQQIVSAHHGEIAYTSNPGHGVTFKVSLPISECPAR